MKKAWKDTLEQGVQRVTETARQRIADTARRVADARPANFLEPAPPPAAQRESLEAARGGVPAQYEEPPVVARMVVEIRSDGGRTIARGALEDVVTGERVQIDAAGASPIQLAASLASSLLSTPFSLSRAAGALVRNRLGRGKP